MNSSEKKTRSDEPAAAPHVLPSAATPPGHPAVESFLDRYLAARPGFAVSLGLHQFDGKISDWSPAGIRAEKRALEQEQRRFEALLPALKTVAARHEVEMALSMIRLDLLRLDGGFEGSPSNPMAYAAALDLNVYLKRNYAPLEQRVHALTLVLEQAPDVFRSARAHLEESLPKPHVETAIQNARGGAEFIARDLPLATEGLRDPKLKTRLRETARLALAEFNRYADWLEATRLPKAHQHFALGRARFVRMLQADLIDLPPERILEMGRQALAAEQRVFADTARKLDPTTPPIKVYQTIQTNHPTADMLIEETHKNLEAIRSFVIEKQLATIPSEFRVQVAETPRYARATSFASMDTPGPFESKGSEAYYYITPVEPEWTPAQQAEWLTAFNRYTTDVVSIHEAYPGHYTQFLWVNATPMTRLRKVYVSYPFAEGWAHYAEQMVIDEGFGQDPKKKDRESERRALSYRLAQSGEALLRLCRLCVSIEMHCGTFSLDEAARFFETQAFYEPKPARQEAIRGTFDPGYLYYTLGKLQLLKLRRDYEQQEGKEFSLLKFHNAVLAAGSPPIRLLRETLLKDPALWPETL